jgi:hypothetical protein
MISLQDELNYQQHSPSNIPPPLLVEDQKRLTSNLELEHNSHNTTIYVRNQGVETNSMVDDQ